MRRPEVVFWVVAVIMMIGFCSLLYASRGSAVSVSYDGSNPRLEEWIARTWPVDLVDEAIDVAWCESRGIPTARNGRYRGLFQIGPVEFRKFGTGSVYDPIDNSKAAFAYYSYMENRRSGAGWNPWSCKP